MLFVFMVLLFLSVFGLQNLNKNIVDFAFFFQLFSPSAMAATPVAATPVASSVASSVESTPEGTAAAVKSAAGIASARAAKKPEEPAAAV